jgi:NAD+ synthase (glutamine-hydrolysing)
MQSFAQDIAVIVGAPSHNKNPKGKSLFNSVYFLADGEIKFTQHKTLLPTYDVFDEYRYFEPAKSWEIVEYKGRKIALTVCEDIWDVGTDDPLYTIIPLDEMQKFSPDLIINVSASPFNYNHANNQNPHCQSKCTKIWHPYVLYQSCRCSDRTYL